MTTAPKPGEQKPLTPEEIENLKAHYNGVPVNNPLVRALATIDAQARALSEAQAASEFKDETNALLQSMIEGEAKLKAELAQAKANQRTPGTNESCFKCKNTNFYGVWDKCKQPSCPIKSPAGG